MAYHVLLIYTQKLSSTLGIYRHVMPSQHSEIPHDVPPGAQEVGILLLPSGGGEETFDS